MLKTVFLVGALALSAFGAMTPVHAAAANEIPTGPGCTLNPFDHTWRCIDFDHCKKAADGTMTDCPVTTGTYLTSVSGGQGTKPVHTRFHPVPLGNLKFR